MTLEELKYLMEDKNIVKITGLFEACKILDSAAEKFKGFVKILCKLDEADIGNEIKREEEDTIKTLVDIQMILEVLKKIYEVNQKGFEEKIQRAYKEWEEEVERTIKELEND